MVEAFFSALSQKIHNVSDKILHHNEIPSNTNTNNSNNSASISDIKVASAKFDAGNIGVQQTKSTTLSELEKDNDELANYTTTA